MCMDKRGFTLVELLAVIIVIGLLAVFALPQVLNQFSNHSEELSEQQKILLEESAYAYLSENVKEYPESGCITVSELVEKDAVDATFAEQIDSSYKTDNYGVKYERVNGTLKVELGKCE